MMRKSNTGVKPGSRVGSARKGVQKPIDQKHSVHKELYHQTQNEKAIKNYNSMINVEQKDRTITIYFTHFSGSNVISLAPRSSSIGKKKIGIGKERVKTGKEYSGEGYNKSEQENELINLHREKDVHTYIYIYIYII